VPNCPTAQQPNCPLLSVSFKAIHRERVGARACPGPGVGGEGVCICTYGMTGTRTEKTMHSEERNNCFKRKKKWIRKKGKTDSQLGRNKRLGQKGLGAAKKDTYKKSGGASDRPSSRSPSGMEPTEMRSRRITCDPIASSIRRICCSVLQCVAMYV